MKKAFLIISLILAGILMYRSCMDYYATESKRVLFKSTAMNWIVYAVCLSLILIFYSFLRDKKE